MQLNVGNVKNMQTRVNIFGGRGTVRDRSVLPCYAHYEEINISAAEKCTFWSINIAISSCLVLLRLFWDKYYVDDLSMINSRSTSNLIKILESIYMLQDFCKIEYNIHSIHYVTILLTSWQTISSALKLKCIRAL